MIEKCKSVLFAHKRALLALGMLVAPLDFLILAMGAGSPTAPAWLASVGYVIIGYPLALLVLLFIYTSKSDRIRRFYMSAMLFCVVYAAVLLLPLIVVLFIAVIQNLIYFAFR